MGGSDIGENRPIKIKCLLLLVLRRFNWPDSVLESKQVILSPQQKKKTVTFYCWRKIIANTFQPIINKTFFFFIGINPLCSNLKHIFEKKKMFLLI